MNLLHYGCLKPSIRFGRLLCSSSVRFCSKDILQRIPKSIHRYKILFFVVAPCMLIVLSLLFVQLMHTNYFKIFKQLKSTIIILNNFKCLTIFIIICVH